MNDSRTIEDNRAEPGDHEELAQLRALAQTHGWQGERDSLSLTDYLQRQLQASNIAVTCTLAPSEKAAPAWACYDCGFSGSNFRTLVQEQGSFEAECPSCGSRHTDETAVVLRELVATLEGLREEQQCASAHVPAATY